MLTPLDCETDDYDAYFELDCEVQDERSEEEGVAELCACELDSLDEACELETALYDLLYIEAEIEAL